MEVAGRGKANPKTKPAEIPSCQPCQLDGNVVEAEGYCIDCGEHLCQTCFDSHRKVRVARNHVLLDKSQMPLVETASPSNDKDIFEACQTHSDELVKYFCAAHGAVGCNVCTTLSHRTCQVDYIPNVAKSYKKSKEYKTLIQSIEELLKSTSKCRDQIQGNLHTADDTFTTALNDLKKFRAEMLAYIDQAEKDILGMARKHKESDQKLMAKLKQDSEAIDKEVNDVKSQLRDNDKQLEMLFVTAKRSHSRIQRLQKECSTLYEQLKIGKYRFKPLAEMQKLVSTNRPFGELVIENTGTVSGAQLVPLLQSKCNISSLVLKEKGKINIKSRDDRAAPWVWGMAMLSGDKLLVTDHYNYSVKMINTVTQQVTSHMAMPSAPRDVTRLPGDEAAVCLPIGGDINIISTLNGLSQSRSIKVKGRCYGICYHDGKLIVGYGEDNKIDILNMKGDVLKSISLSSRSGEKYSYIFMYVTVQETMHGAFIYTSHWESHTITKLTMDGRIINQYTEPRLNPRGITVLDDAHLAVCSEGKGKVLVLKTDDDGGMKTVKTWDCGDGAGAIELSVDRKKMYISRNLYIADNNVYAYTLAEM